MIEKKTREELMAIYPCSEDCMVPELVGEVVKLRAENERLEQVVADKTSRIQGMIHAEANAKSHYERVEAKLAWFEEREQWFIDKCDDEVQAARESWEAEHPKPE